MKKLTSIELNILKLVSNNYELSPEGMLANLDDDTTTPTLEMVRRAVSKLCKKNLLQEKYRGNDFTGYSLTLESRDLCDNNGKETGKGPSKKAHETLTI